MVLACEVFGRLGGWWRAGCHGFGVFDEAVPMAGRRLNACEVASEKQHGHVEDSMTVAPPIGRAVGLLGCLLSMFELRTTYRWQTFLPESESGTLMARGMLGS